MFDLGSVPYKDSDELCIACVLSAHALSVQKGSLRYPALFDFAAVLHNEMGVIAASNNHENGPETGVRLNMVVYPAPYKRGLRERINLPAPIFHRPTR